MANFSAGIVIPSYRCENQIGRVIKGLSEQAGLRARISKIWILDNCSNDRTVAVALEAIKVHNVSEWILVAQNAENYGLGGSQKLAFQIMEENSLDWLFIFHGDDQPIAADIPKLIAVIDNDPSLDAVLGSRFSHGSRLDGYSLVRILGNVVLNWVYTLFLGKRIYDLGSGLNAFKVKSYPYSVIRFFDSAFVFNCSLLVDLFQRRLKFTFVPIVWREFDQVSNTRNFQVAKRILFVLLKWRFKIPTKQDPLANKQLAYSIIK